MLRTTDENIQEQWSRIGINHTGQNQKQGLYNTTYVFWGLIGYIPGTIMNTHLTLVYACLTIGQGLLILIRPSEGKILIYLILKWCVVGECADAGARTPNGISRIIYILVYVKTINKEEEKTWFSPLKEVSQYYDNITKVQRKLMGKFKQLIIASLQ